MLPQDPFSVQNPQGTLHAGRVPFHAARWEDAFGTQVSSNLAQRAAALRLCIFYMPAQLVYAGDP